LPFRAPGLALLKLPVLLVAVWLAGACARATMRPPPGNGTGTKPARVAAPVVEPVVAVPSPEEPVTAAAWVSPGAVGPGGAAELRVRVRVAAGHYLHPPGARPPFIPTSLDVVPNRAVRPAGDSELVTGADAAGRLAGTVEFRRPIRVDDRSPTGPCDLACTLTFQACTPELCWPARTLTLTAPLTVSAAAIPRDRQTRETP
jgi:hypothetical protein